MKRRIGKFFESKDGEVVFALKEDDEGEIHYRYCTYDTDTYQISEGKFYKEFSQQD